MKNLAAIILAAGKGTRMKSSLPKVLHRVAGKPMLFYPIELLKQLKAGRIIAVIGHGADQVKSVFKEEKITFVNQTEQLGTGHAVMTALKALGDFAGGVLILSGDVPLITKETITALVKHNDRKGKKKAVMSLVTTILDDPKGYGRIVREEHGAVVRIVEEKDCSLLQKKINEVNAGIYYVSAKFLFENIKKLGKDNAQGEYYLPDLVQLATHQGEHVAAITHVDPNEVMGINNRVELANANLYMRRRINQGHMMDGVTIINPDVTYIDYGVKIGLDSTIYPNVHLLGNVSIGPDCIIEEGVRIQDSSIGDNSTIKSYSIIEESKVGKDVTIGPVARLRPGNLIKDNVRIGNFVEVKKSTLGKGTKANHLTYIGDSVIGENVNIGAGTITCNYDGVNKYQTTIEDGAFIGSDSQLVAPVKVGKGAYVGSGTTVTKDVPPDSLVITRAPEKVIEGWAKRRKKKAKK